MTTQFAKASYQEIIDLHTEEDTVSVIGIHTPQGDTPRKMFGGFFDQFKKFKYLGCSVSLVPAARLPADPLQVSYEAGEPTIDPRDMLNPLMFHGCHGNDMGVILNRFYNTNSIADQPQTDSTFYYADSITDLTDGDHISGLQLEDLYYKALTDNTWKKAHPQRGFKKGGLRPLVYSMATNMQFSGGDSIGMAGFGIPEDLADDVSASGTSITATFPVSQNGRRFFTPRLTGLGWLDTRNVLTTATTVTGSTADIRAMLGDAALAQQDASEADLPLVYMGMILLPPAYKTEQYFRMIVNHHFAFKDFRGISFSNNLVEPPAYNQLNDPDARYYPEESSVDPPTPDPPEPDPPTPVEPDYRSLTYGSTDIFRGDTVYKDLEVANAGAAVPVPYCTVDGSTKLFPNLIMMSQKLYVCSGFSATDKLYYFNYANHAVDTRDVYYIDPSTGAIGFTTATNVAGYDQDYFDTLAASYFDSQPIILQPRSS